MPFAVAIGSFLAFLKLMNTHYEKADPDKFVNMFIWIGVFGGFIAMMYMMALHAGLGGIIHQKFQELIAKASSSAAVISTWGKIQAGFAKFCLFIGKWFPVYLRAFIVSWIICGAIEIQSLRWRVNFLRGSNIIISTFLMAPFLSLQYMIGKKETRRQTPFFDFLMSRLYVAKIKENINDSYFAALQGYDDKGNKFENGMGGTAQTQKIKAIALAMRHSRCSIVTVNGTRNAKLQVRKSRETETDRGIAQVLKGLGQRLTASSIRFQDDPIFDGQWYTFDSQVPYNAGKALGEWQAIFNSPFATYEVSTADSKKIQEGALTILAGDFRALFDYIAHFTPVAVYDRLVDSAAEKYVIDRSGEKAKYQVQQNLDLSVIPTPKDPKTGNDIATQRRIAMQRAQERIGDVTAALNANKLGGTFEGVKVGGNTAIYTYVLPRSANLPSDLDKAQNSVANLLGISDIPVITIHAGKLEISMVNGVNIPVDFRDMINNRASGVSNLISGLAGVDALGNNITFELGDRVPHAILFGKTGTGKTVTIMTILYSIMSATDPDHLKIAYVDGKGNSFEFMRTDNAKLPNGQPNPNYHPNPFTYTQPADGSGDTDYARAVIKHMEKVTRKRIEMFKNEAVSKLAEYNRKHPDKMLPEILLVCDEFSALTDTDKQLKASEVNSKGMTPIFEYLAKMSRSVGIRMLLANQTARKSKVPGVISANIPGRLSLGVTEGIEAEIALPGTGIALDKIDQPGEFYSTMNSKTQPEHGNSPYLPDSVMYALNDSLEQKFGHHDYVVTRDQIMAEFNGEDSDNSSTEGNTNSNSTSSISSSTNKAQLVEALPHPATNQEPKDLQTALNYLDKYPAWSVKQIESYNEAWTGKLRPSAPHKIPATVKNAPFINFDKGNQVPRFNDNGTQSTKPGPTPLAERAERRIAYREAYLNARKKVKAMQVGEQYQQQVQNHKRRQNAGQTLSTADIATTAMHGQDNGVL